MGGCRLELVPGRSAMEQLLEQYRVQLESTANRVAALEQEALNSRAETQSVQQAFRLLTGLESDTAGTKGAKGGKGRRPVSVSMDARLLGRPDRFAGDESKWSDWSVLMKAYCEACFNGCSELMDRAASTNDAVERQYLGEWEQVVSAQLHGLLLSYTGGEPFNIIQNAGVSEGLLAWRRLTQRYELGPSRDLLG